MIASKQQTVFSLLWRSACGFSKFSKRQTTPKILRDHRFTRKGMVLRKEPKSYEHDLTNLPASQAHQEHLFYNKEDDLALWKQKALEKEKNLKNKHVFEDHSVAETLLLEVQDSFLITNHPDKVLNSLVELDKKFAAKGGETRELIQTALHRLIQDQILSFSLRNFGVLTTLARKYLTNDSKIWENLANNYCRLLQKNEYNDRKILDSARSQKQLENAVLTLTTVLKFANKFHHEKCIDHLADIASSYLSSNIDVVENTNTRFLLIANVLPLVPSVKQVELITQVKSKQDEISKLQANTLTALTHSIYKVKQQNAKNSGFPADLIDVALLQKVEQAWLKSFDKKDVQMLSIYSFSLASLGYSGETKKFTQEFVEKNIKEITNLRDLALLGETLKKFRALSPKYFAGAEVTLKEAISANTNQLPADLALQFLRVHAKNLFINSEIAQSLIKIIDQAYYYDQFKPTAGQKDMVVKTIQKYSQIVDLSNLRIYQNLIGSKKIL